MNSSEKNYHSKLVTNTAEGRSRMTELPTPQPCWKYTKICMFWFD